MTKFGILGLGRMGGAIARRALAAGMSPLVYDISDQRRSELMTEGAEAASDLASFLANVDVVVSCLPSPAACLAVVRDTASSTARPSFWVETSTIGQQACAEIEQILEKRGVRLIDAPISGGPRGKSLTSILAGQEHALVACMPLIERYSDRVITVGSRAGQAQICKLVNNALSLGTLALAAEVTAAGVRAGADLGALIEVINASSGRSAATTDKFPQSILTRSFDYGASIEVAAKDIELFLANTDTGKRGSVSIVTAIADIWRRTRTEFGPEGDFTNVYRYFERETNRGYESPAPRLS